jgi:cytochrome c553
MGIETPLWLAAMGRSCLLRPEVGAGRKAGFSISRLGSPALRWASGYCVNRTSTPSAKLNVPVVKKLATLFAAAFLAAPVYAQQADSKLVSGCVPCHGAAGIAKFGEVPNLAGQNAPYLLNQLRAFHTGKRVHKEMRYMSRKMTEKEMEAIAVYFSSLPPR